MDALENQLKEARFLAEEADKKYDEVRQPSSSSSFEAGCSGNNNNNNRDNIDDS